MAPKRYRHGGAHAFVAANPLLRPHHPFITPIHASSCNPSRSPSPSMSLSKLPLRAIAGAAAGLLLLFPSPHDTLALSDAQRLVAEAWRIVDKAYVDRTFNNHDWFSVRMKAVKHSYPSVPDAYPAIRDMLALLADPYTRFLTPDQYSSLTSTATGELAGVGVEMFPSRVDDQIAVSATIDNSPAARAGVLPQDTIALIDGESTEGLTPDEAAARIRGKPGTSVSLTVVHRKAKGGSEETMQLTRQNLKLNSVSIASQTNGTVVAKIKEFNSTTAADLGNALAKQTPFRRLVLDLRNNPGGYFPGGVDVARLFMKAHTPIVYVVDKNGIEEETDAIVDGAYADVPLVAVVNKRTASASEILAGALKDNRRAKLVGEKTYGKGVVQTVSQLSDGSGLAVTVARYETPGHNNINKIGILPDVTQDCDIDADVLTCVPRDVW